MHKILEISHRNADLTVSDMPQNGVCERLCGSVWVCARPEKISCAKFIHSKNFRNCVTALHMWINIRSFALARAAQTVFGYWIIMWNERRIHFAARTQRTHTHTRLTGRAREWVDFEMEWNGERVYGCRQHLYRAVNSTARSSLFRLCTLMVFKCLFVVEISKYGVDRLNMSSSTSSREPRTECKIKWLLLLFCHMHAVHGCVCVCVYWKSLIGADTDSDTDDSNGTNRVCE